MKVLKVLGVLLVIAIALFLFAANFSAVDSRYECSGTLSSNGTEQPSTIFLKLETYRPWVGLWSDSRGSAWVELPNQTVSYFEHITEAGDQLQLWGPPNKLGGNFSSLSKAITVDLGAFGVFEGRCRSIRTDA
jgi:hypothetical protein